VRNRAAWLYISLCLVVGLVLIDSPVKAIRSDATTMAVENYPSCRFGVTAEGDITAYDTAALNTGWYVNWGFEESPATPGGMEFVNIVRVKQVGVDGWDFKSGASWPSLNDAIAASPGALWLVGNEPDSHFQDDMLPKAYANAYHDLYAFIKAQDPKAQVGIGGIVQPTPLRFSYLERVLSAYADVYGGAIPVDVWNIHSFILRETIEAPDPDPCGENTIPVWGAYIPPGNGSQSGELYCMRDQDDLGIFWQRIREFRRWMAENGQRYKPLIITEYGVLFPEDYSDEDSRPFSQSRVGAFMTGTFDLMLNQSEPTIGYPYDGNRLVQRWAWFSVNGNPYDMGGTLFDPATKQIRLLGEMYRDYTSVITPTVDLMAYTVPAVYLHEGPPVTATIRAVVSNKGNVSTTSPVTVTFYDGPPGDAGTNQIGAPSVISAGLNGCAEYGVVETQWAGLNPGVHRFYVSVAGGSTGLQDDNVAEGIVLVAISRAFLPEFYKEH
jgi:hypothetical protein